MYSQNSQLHELRSICNFSPSTQRYALSA